MEDDAAELLRGPRQEARDVDEGDQRDVERIAEADETGALDRRIDVEHTGERLGLVADDADHVTVEAREADHQVLRVERGDLEEVVVVDDQLDHLLHVVRLGSAGRG